MPHSFSTRLAALLAGGVVALGVAACEDRNENQIDEGSESDSPASTVQTVTEGLGPANTQTVDPTTQEQQPLTQTTP